MTEVFFYYGASDKIAAACALLAGAWKKRRPIVVFAPEKTLADSVDRLLWTREQLSFIPHCRADSPLASETPIVIADLPGQLARFAQYERLMNLSTAIPEDYACFQRLIEVVGQQEDEREAARARVHRYRQAGCNVQYFDLNNR